ncbi:MAG: hypothetical protein HRU76_00075 [Phycisphaeraceae bacterium]|nr:hypothetical protein [Phycisphaerales bacterium]QOJ16089.1 MAG: hypothetical protein HRU76_00075 [Phycisphaeraceae bacterium]
MADRLPIRQSGAAHFGGPRPKPAPRRFSIIVEGGVRFSIIDLRRALKSLRRDFGLVCVDAREVAAPPPAAGPAEGGGGGR